MLTIGKYERVKTLQEAYDLIQNKNSLIIGGMQWLKMQDRRIQTAVDLCDLGLNQIEETDDAFIIGSMVTLRQLEKHEGLNGYFDGAVEESVKHIVGVQFRNMATLGGSIYGRYGFSDLLTVFMAMDAEVELFKAGVMKMTEFSQMGFEKDIVVRIIVKKTGRKVVYLSHRNTETDFPVLTCGAYKDNGQYGVVIGARPGRGMLFTADVLDATDEQNIKDFAKEVSLKAPMGSNMRGSADYRRRLCRTLIKRSILQLEGGK